MATPPPPAPSLAMACTDAIADVYALPSGLPAYDSSHRGDVIRCAKDKYLSAAQINALFPSYQYKGAAAVSGFWTYRLAFRTERVKPDSMPAGSPNPEGTSSATLLIPDHPIKNGPLVVFAHGTVGLGDACAPSLYDLTKAPTASTEKDYPVNLMSMGGQGYTVIMPDYSGFGFNAVPGYFDAPDEAHSVLDASRAAAHLLPAEAAGATPINVVIVGHSQGGHAALAAQAIATSYGSAGTVVGVAAFAPFWISMASWGAITTPLSNVRTTGTIGNQAELLYAMYYFYSAGELLDGPGGGVAMYQSSKQALAKQTLLSPTCFDSKDLQALGITPDQFFDPDFVNNVGADCAVMAKCTAPASATWLKRWQNDRPALDPKGAPVLLWLGAKDGFISPSYGQCVQNKLNKDFAGAPPTQITYCGDPNAGHNDVIRLDADYVNAWIGARAGVGSDPAPCTPFPTGQSCPTLPADL